MIIGMFTAGHLLWIVERKRPNYNDPDYIDESTANGDQLANTMVRYKYLDGVKGVCPCLGEGGDGMWGRWCRWCVCVGRWCCSCCKH